MMHCQRVCPPTLYSAQCGIGVVFNSSTISSSNTHRMTNKKSNDSTYNLLLRHVIDKEIWNKKWFMQHPIHYCRSALL